MATIVKLKKSDSHAILLGVGYGQFRTARPDTLWGNALAKETSGESPMVAVSSAVGKILWCRSEELEIISIDGESPIEILRPFFAKK